MESGKGDKASRDAVFAVVSVSGVHVKDVTQRAIILECAKICSHELQLICKDQLTEHHMKCSKAQEPCKFPEPPAYRPRTGKGETVGCIC